MRALLVLLLLSPLGVVAEEIRLEVGAPREATRAALQKLAAVDITPNMEIVGPHGEWPLHDLEWSVSDFKLILELSLNAKSEGLGPICYWTEQDFDVSKTHREKSRRYAQSIVFDTVKKTYIVTDVKKKP